MKDILRYAGKCVVVSGAASGMGEAAARIPGPIDAIFNCAGVPRPPFSNLDTMKVNFIGRRHFSESLLPRLRDGGAIASITWTKQQASRLCARGIRVHCLSPAPTATPMLPAFHEQIGKAFLDQHFQAPVGRDATSEEMAEPLILLNSHAARFVSGHNLFVDYGYAGSVDVGDRPALL